MPGMMRRRPERKGTGRGGYHPKAEPSRRDVKIRLYTPHPGQAKLHACKARFRIVCCGRRWGKTLAGVNEIAKHTWENPKMNGMPVTTWWVAPTYQQSRKAYDRLSNGFAGAIEKKHSAVGQMSVTWENGAVTEFKSTERYDNLRGEGVPFMVVDEAAMVPREAWEKVLRPMLSDTMGSALLISTPRGKNWFYALYQRGLDPDEPEYASFSFPTASSPYIDPAEVEEARKIMPEDAFAQEFLGEFLDEVAGVFHGVDDCVCGELEEPLADHRYVIGWDIAKRQDFSVIVVIDVDHQKGGQVVPHVVAFERFNTLSYTVQAERVKAVADKYRTYVLLDSTGVGDPVFDMLRSKNVPCFPYAFTARSKEMLIQNLAIDIQSKSISYPEIPELLYELHNYQYSMSQSGKLIYSAPEGEHDDCVTALALADWAARHPAWMQEPVLSFDYDEIISPI